MNNKFPRIGTVFAALFFLLAGYGETKAQAVSSDASQPRTASPEELSQAELLKAYLQVREQLHATQMAIVNNRVEALTDKLDAIKSTMETERERQQAERDRQQGELQRAAAERERQHIESQHANRAILWVAATFGGVGLLAMLVVPFFQWRAFTRITESGIVRTQLPSTPPAGLLPAVAAADQTVTTSSQRLMSVIDRMEERIHELEHTAAPPAPPPAPAQAAPPLQKNGHWTNGVEAVRRTNANSDDATWISVLLSKGKSLLAANKAREAVACYEEVLKLDPTQPEALVRKGTALERMNRFEEALQCYERAIVADGRMTLAYVSKGSVCNRLGRYDEALECYEQALHVAEKK